MILPFVETPQPWNFSSGADSISISGHKMLGAPMPCGVVIARKSHVDRISRSIEYIGALDTTIAGSRSGFSPLVLWHRMRTLGEQGMREIVQGCLERAEMAVQRLQAHGVPAWRHVNSITVVFPRPPKSMMEKWIIAPKKDIGHLIVMPHVTAAMLEEFITDYVQAFQGTAETHPHQYPV